MTTTSTTAPDATVCRDGQVAEPYSPAELDGIRSAFEFYDSTDMIPRLVATVEALAGGEQS